MRIVWLLERTDQLWGGVKVALTDANWLARRGHDVTVLSRTAPPAWLDLQCAFQRVDTLSPAVVPPADVVIGTYWTTVPAAAGVRGARAVHFCQGYEGDAVEHDNVRAQIEAVYRLPGVHHVTIAPHLTALLRRRFAIAAREVVYATDHDVCFPAPARPAGRPLRVGLVGPYEVPWKDIATGLAACRLAHRAGLQLQLVRVTNTAPHADEREQPFPVEWHERVRPERMGDIYRSLDVFLGTSSGAEEGFFLPAVEAMACGVPCVLTDVPCFRAHGDHQYALFVPPRDPPAMAEALVVAGRSPEVATALRSGGIAAARRYTQDAHGKALLAVLADVTGHGKQVAAARRTDGGDLVDLGARLTRELRDGAARLQAAADHERAAAFLAAAHCLCPGDAGLAADAAWALHQAGDTAGALRMFTALVEHGFDQAAVHERRAHLLNGSGQPAAAAQAFRAAIAAGRRDADTYNSLGIALFRTGDVAGARSSFERALVLQPDHQDALANVADLPAH